MSWWRSKGWKRGVDPSDLASSGWGVIFPADTDRAVLQALEPLLQHRRAQAAARNEERYREFTQARGARVDDTLEAFLDRQRVGAGPADPDQLPYYLMIVGGPELVSYDLQFDLDLTYAVGRLALGAPEDYARYAEAIVANERSSQSDQSLGVFGVSHRGDQGTVDASMFLIQPLLEKVRVGFPDLRMAVCAGPTARREQLGTWLEEEKGPRLIFASCHGLAFPPESPRLRTDQGALLCADWPGPDHDTNVRITPDHYFAARDLSDQARPEGRILFLHGCFTAGTPIADASIPNYPRQAKQLPTEPFVARLPERLLSHPRGPALAVIGHVGQTWTTAFRTGLRRSQIQTYESAIASLLSGEPVGLAMESFGQRYAEAAINLLSHRGSPDSPALIRLWLAYQDARAYTVLGDPAARLPRAAGPSVAPRIVGESPACASNCGAFDGIL